MNEIFMWFVGVCFVIVLIQQVTILFKLNDLLHKVCAVRGLIDNNHVHRVRDTGRIEDRQYEILQKINILTKPIADQVGETAKKLFMNINKED